MMNDDDDSTFTFQTLSAATERVLLKSCKLTIERKGSRDVSSSSILRRVEVPEEKCLPLFSNCGTPSFPVAAPRNTFESRCILPALGSIGLIKIGGCLTKIGNPIVPPVAVDVVQYVSRPAAMDMKPCEPMRAVVPLTDSDTLISSLGMARDTTFPAPSVHSNLPTEDAGLGTIVQDRSNFVGSDHLDAHEEKNEETDPDRQKKDAEKKRRSEHREYVIRRLLEIGRFERRARGKGFKR